MLNVTTIMGRICKDVDLRKTNGGTSVCSFSLACDRDYSKDGERGVDFIDCVAWRGTAEFIERNFPKGAMICVTGRLQIRDWTDKDGNKRRSAEILVDNAYFTGERRNTERSAEAPAERREPAREQPSAPREVPPPQEYHQGKFAEMEDGELPF